MRVAKDNEGKESKETRKEDSQETEREGGRAEENERRKGQEEGGEKSGRVVATKPNTVSRCVSEARGKNRNCKMCNCKLSSGGRTQGLLATSAEGPSQAGLSPFFLPWISSNCSKGLRKQKERERKAQGRKRERDRETGPRLPSPKRAAFF